MKTPRARKTRKAGRKPAKASTAQLLQDNAGMALRRGRDTLSRAYDWAHEAHLGSLRMPRRADISHLTEANPLLLGAVGLGLGVAIGTLFPRGMAKNRSGTSPRAANSNGNGAATRPKSTARRRRKKASAAVAG